MNKTILEAVVGSTVHGTAVQDGLEDLDLMAVVLEPPQRLVGFTVEDTWVTRSKPMGVRSEAGDVDHVAYGLRKFLTLALKGNPSILLALFVPQQHVREISPQGHALRALAPDIVSRRVYPAYQGYMRQQHERLLGVRGQRNVTRPELVQAYGYDTKYAAHVLRLGLQGEELLLTGRISLPMPDADRALVVKMRTGGFSLAEVSQQIVAVQRRLDTAHAGSPLREMPNSRKVEQWMIETYLAHWTTPDAASTT